MKIIKIISEWKKFAKDLKQGYKRVMAVVEINGEIMTRHIDVPK